MKHKIQRNDSNFTLQSLVKTNKEKIKPNLLTATFLFDFHIHQIHKQIFLMVLGV